MKKLDINFLAVVIVVGIVACFIAVLHYTSFERHHTHDWPRKQSQTSQETTNQNNVSENSSVTSLNGDKSINGASPRQTYPSYTDQQSLQHDDHKAQIVMAIFTGLGLLVALIGLYMIWRTLVHTGDASRSAADTLKIAQDTLEETKTAHVRSQRAYVGIMAFNYHFRPMQDGRAVFVPTAIITNFGQTPAYNQKNSSRIEIVDISNVEDIEVGPLTSAGITLFPNSEPMLSNRIIFSAENVRAIISQTKRVFIAVHITYEDIFGNQHWSKTHYVLGNTGQGNRFSEEHGATLT